jgi:HEAT repeat protein
VALHPAEPSFTLAAFVRELALAWQKQSMYQEGHPARRQVVDRVMPVLLGLVAPTGSVAIGVDRDALVGVDERIDNNLARRLAETLYDRSVAILRFDEGIDAAELERFLGLLPRTRAREDEAPLWDVLAEHGIEHVRMEPIDFSGVVAAEGTEGETGPRTEVVLLWQEILRRLLSDERFAGEARGLAKEDEVGLAEIRSLIERVLRRHGIDPAALGADQAPLAGQSRDLVAALSGLVGRAAAARVGGGTDRASRAASARHVAELLGAVPEAMRDGVLDAALMGLVADDERVEGSLEDLSGSLSAAEVVASLRRLRQERVQFSSRMLGLLEDLVLRAAPLSADVGLGADELTEGLRTLFQDDDVDRVVPAQRRMDRLALELRHATPHRAEAEELDPRLRTLDETRQLLQLAQTLLDLLQRPIFSDAQLVWIADRVERVVQALLAGGRVTNAVRLVRGLKVLAGDRSQVEPVRAAAEHCLDRLGQADTIAALVEALGSVGSGAAVEVVRQLIEVLGPRVIRELLLALCEETDLARRRHTFDLLASLGSEVTPYAVDLLADDRWYVRRNMLSLLRQIGDPIPLNALRSSLEHADARVRLEAVKSLGSVSPEPPRELLAALLEDEDAKIAESTAGAIGATRLAAGRDLLVALLKRADPLARNTPLRVRALQALGQIGDPAVLEDLGHFFRGWFAVVSPDERKAAFASLRGYPPEVRVDWAKKGLRAPDPAVREICRKLAGGGGSGP